MKRTSKAQAAREEQLQREAAERLRRARLALERAEENDRAWERRFSYSFEPETPRQNG